MTARLVVRRSAIHARGVFATVDLPAQTRLIEYRGARIGSQQALDRGTAMIEQGQTFLFRVNQHYLIDGAVGGNSARFLNHSCAPNCEAVIWVDINGDEQRDKVWIETLRAVRAGEELCFDYGLQLAVPHSARLKRIWACHCGAPNCSGTLLKPKARFKPDS